MGILSVDSLPEVFLSTTPTRRNISRWTRSGLVRQLAPRLYTRNLKDEPEAIIRRNLWFVVGLLFPGTLVSHRTAIENGPSSEGTINLTGSYSRIVELPGLTVRLIPGPGPLPGDTQYIAGLWLASRPRALLECLRPTRSSAAGPRGLPRETIEALLDRRLAIAGEEDLNRIRDRAREMVEDLDAEREFAELEAIVGGLLGTRESRPSAPTAIARAQGEPYDPHRLERFQELHAALRDWPGAPRPVESPSDADFANAAFVDAYFSNYIEGTEFEVDEAIGIVFHGRIPETRPADAHDVLGTYRVVGSRDEMSRSAADLPDGYEGFQRLLAARQSAILSARPDKRPGEFKSAANRAGATYFVDPLLAKGTLRKGYELFRSLSDPFARAAFMMFLVAEVHPFDDGNGRVSRAMMNAELVSSGQARIVIPTVYRDDYMLSLRALTRHGRTEPFLKMLDRAQEFVWRIDFSELDAVVGTLRACNAFADPDDSRLRLPSRTGP